MPTAPKLGHRHDGGDVAHGPIAHEGITVGIQGILALCIVATIATLIFVVVSL